MINRRSLIGTLGGASLAALWPLSARSAVVGRVLVVGGGMAGATVAKYLRMWSNGTVDVTAHPEEVSPLFDYRVDRVGRRFRMQENTVFRVFVQASFNF